MLQKDVHDAFAGLQWCLKPTEVWFLQNHYEIKPQTADKKPFLIDPEQEDDVYTLKFFRNSGLVKMFRSQGLDTPLKFKNRSAEFCEYKDPDKCELHLPDPHFISIHSTIATIINMSGANEFFDALLDPLRDAEGNYPSMRCWDEFERVVEICRLREELVDAFLGN